MARGGQMNLEQWEDSEARFAAYVEGLSRVIGHADRAGPLRDYCTGLMLPGERKSVEPMAARTAPARTAAQHQSLLHFVANAAWSDGPLCSASSIRLSDGVANGEIGSVRGNAWLVGGGAAMATPFTSTMAKNKIYIWQSPCR